MEELQPIQAHAIDRIKLLGKDGTRCLFCTNLTQIPHAARPMIVQQADDQGNVWFFSSESSEMNAEINEDDRVQLHFMNNAEEEYLVLYGTATLLVDKQKAAELWNAMVKTWFPGGPEDPSLTLIKFIPQDGYFWATKSNKMVRLGKTTAVTPES